MAKIKQKVIPDFKGLESIHFLGIGGIGMSALARYFKKQGINISGYDKTPSELTQQLQREGMTIGFRDDIRLIPKQTRMAIYTPAVPADLRQLAFLNQSGLPVLKRSEVLGLLTQNKKTIAIAGTHGKTTVTSLTAYLLSRSKQGCTAFLGGIAKNFNSNFVFSDDPSWMVVEADEYDRSFLHLKPYIAVITSMDADHLDVYKDYSEMKKTYVRFASGVKNNGTLLVKDGVSINHLPGNESVSFMKYSILKQSEFHAENIRLNNGYYNFDFHAGKGVIKNLQLGMPGLINVENGCAAIAAATMAGVTADEIKKALPDFSGIKRRFDIQINEPDLVFIDDYAHHPEEIRGFVTSVKQMFPGKKISGVFQPHLFSRTRDFAEGFARSLELLDDIYLLPIYPARELPLKNVTSRLIFDQINKTDKTICSKDKLIKLIESNHFEILLTMGAGDIDQLVEPIKSLLLQRLKKPLS